MCRGSGGEGHLAGFKQVVRHVVDPCARECAGGQSQLGERTRQAAVRQPGSPAVSRPSKQRRARGVATSSLHQQQQRRRCHRLLLAPPVFAGRGTHRFLSLHPSPCRPSQLPTPRRPPPPRGRPDRRQQEPIGSAGHRAEERVAESAALSKEKRLLLCVLCGCCCATEEERLKGRD